jgi:hypothetical protein
MMDLAPPFILSFWINNQLSGNRPVSLSTANSKIPQLHIILSHFHQSSDLANYLRSIIIWCIRLIYLRCSN